MKLIAYYRVSSKQQGKSGLGLDAQRRSVRDYAERIGATIIHEYVEIETGTKKRTRPILQQALAHTRHAGATLCIAKLDRLARNVRFTAGLLESGVEFCALDCPHANKLTIHIMAAMAEYEADMISKRTKDALAEKKAQGIKLGSARDGHWDKVIKKYGRDPRDPKKASAAAAQKRTEEARDAYSFLYSEIRTKRRAGATLDEIADALNRAGHRTRKGKEFTKGTVCRILQRA